jgi:hypothetical protein
MSNPIKIGVGNKSISESKRAVTISKSKKTGSYDSIQWTTSEAGTFTIDFGSASKSPFQNFTYSVKKNSPAKPVVKSNATEDVAFKYIVRDSNGDPVDDPYVIIEK